MFITAELDQCLPALSCMLCLPTDVQMTGSMTACAAAKSMQAADAADRHLPDHCGLLEAFSCFLMAMMTRGSTQSRGEQRT